MMRSSAEKLAEVNNIFSNTKRVLIFWLLMEKEMCVNKIAEAIGTSVQNISQHLRLMKANNILESRRDGQTIFYQIADNELGRFCKLIHVEYLAEFDGGWQTSKEDDFESIIHTAINKDEIRK